ncbi:type III-B CRISPR module RAMP protein Cmr4 [Hugenholtzia roseola]|uniref:type III-B CRISPR module RAMP protein Cmr4 n=1 Tax=Hugenholtzia roseola TaxID=1002 RepID=UPI00047A9047|nr:type III-B CRISPR module RAMP protein Cmr4 [Hugenholtzia roseola]
MYKLAKPLFLHCQSPMHVGSGSDLGLVDLPIQRESHTGFPKIEASSLKGAIREHFEGKATNDNDWYDIQLAFGFDKDSLPPNVESKFKDSKDRDFSGALAFSDARLLFFPVKSFKGIFAYVTCPQVLTRFKNDLKICGRQDTNINALHDALKLVGIENTVADKNHLCTNNGVDELQVILEEYAFEVTENENTKALAAALSEHLEIHIDERIVILPDNVFSDFVKLYTEVITRNKIDNAKGTVAKGALFTEEYLPAESILYSLIFANSIFTANDERKGSFVKDEKESEEQKVQKYFASKVNNSFMQIGGNSTLGKGIVKTKF